jgi:hypothetical protein
MTAVRIRTQRNICEAERTTDIGCRARREDGCESRKKNMDLSFLKPTLH